jgi:hypothetical protein
VKVLAQGRFQLCGFCYQVLFDVRNNKQNTRKDKNKRQRLDCLTSVLGTNLSDREEIKPQGTSYMRKIYS